MSSKEPLLSPKPFKDFSPEEWQEYVRSLHQAPVRKVRVPKERALPKLTLRRTKTGKLSARTTRKDPKWITDAEVAEATERLTVKQNEMFLFLKSKNFIRVRDETEVREIQARMSELPW